MGNQQSTAEAISSTVNKAVTNVMLSNSNTCSQNNSSVQNLSFTRIRAGPGCNLNFNDISQTNTQTPNFSCASQSNQQSSLQTALQAALSQAVKSETGGIGGALNSTSNSKTVSNLINDITNNVNISNTATCLQNSMASQDMPYDLINSSCPAVCNNPNVVPPAGLCTVNFNNIKQVLTQKATANCLSENSSFNEAINKATAEVSQIAASENTGFNPLKDLANLVGGAANMYIVSIIVVICCCLLPIILSSVISSLGSPGSPGSSTELSEAYPPSYYES